MSGKKFSRSNFVISLRYFFKRKFVSIFRLYFIDKLFYIVRLMTMLFCIFRHAICKKSSKRGIYIKHFKNIPMADMELVLVSKVLKFID